jgi:protein-tyrosine phosphatase
MKDRPYKLLFICMGNICRSPTAEGIMETLISDAGLQDKIVCDSAGTLSYHEGSPPDRRMTTAAAKAGYTLQGRSRPITVGDLKEFDLILTMDNDNLEGVRHLDRSGQYRDKIIPICNFAPDQPQKEVPDPYYGGTDGFHQVVRLLETTCKGLLEEVKKRIEV